MKGYKQLTLSERKIIEQSLYEGKSFREIARLTSRNASTISREVKTNRCIKATKIRRQACKDRNWCKRIALCDKCYHKGAYCVGCARIDCRDVCSSYETQNQCHILVQAPWVCNGCRKNRYGCNRSNRFVYLADSAHKVADERRSETRRGINTAGLDMTFVESTLRDALKRGLSPYETATLYADVCKVSSSTLYRWVEAGVGDTCNLDLERQVGFKPRRGERRRKTTSHTKKRNYDTFLSLSAERQSSALEMDCVEGLQRNSQVLLTLYHRPSHLQIALLLPEKTCKYVIAGLTHLFLIADKSLYQKVFGTVLTDNGSEFEDEDSLEYVISGQMRRVHLFYCDPRQSQQKGRCEKNHTEIRQILPKGKVDFDELNAYDIAVMCSHINSNPRLSLCGFSPIEMFYAAYGKKGKVFLDGLGIVRISRSDLYLIPEIINIEREKRGEEPLIGL